MIMCDFANPDHSSISNFDTGQALGIQIAHQGTEVVKEVKHGRSLLEAGPGRHDSGGGQWDVYDHV